MTDSFKSKEQIIWEFKSSLFSRGLWGRRGQPKDNLGETLRWQAARLQEQAELLDLALDCIMVRDLQHRILFWNKSSEQRYGWSKEEALGQVFHELLRTDFPRPLKDLQMELIKNGHWEGEVVHTNRKGRRVVVESLWTLRRDENGLPQAVLVINHDITDRKHREQQLLEYQRRLRAMATELSKFEEGQRRRIATDLHDGVGQHLAMCKLRLKMLGQARPEVASLLAEAVALLDQAIKETRLLVTDLSPPVLYELGLHAALEWLVERDRQRYGIAIDLVNEAGPLPLDEEVSLFLFRAASELLLNVSKHAAATRAVVSLSRHEQTLVLGVSDNGRGMAASSGQPLRPWGFGLFSIRERLESMGGRIKFLTSPGRGVEITLELPLATGERLEMDGGKDAD